MLVLLRLSGLLIETICPLVLGKECSLFQLGSVLACCAGVASVLQWASQRAHVLTLAPRVIGCVVCECVSMGPCCMCCVL